MGDYNLLKFFTHGLSLFNEVNCYNDDNLYWLKDGGE